MRSYIETMIPQASPRPRSSNSPATLALLCYNQDGFIAPALSAALEQTYQPLTILISDDCSTDSTYSIIRSMVEGYTGPHDVRLNRTERNLGLIEHLHRVVEMIDTEVVIPAAGDDISEPNRVAELMAAWSKHPSADAVCSGSTYIDEGGHVLGIQQGAPLSGYCTAKDRLLGRIILGTDVLYGASAGWRRSLLLDYPRVDSGAAEDVVIGFRALMGGGIVFVDQPLVRYRKHASNLWSVSSTSDSSEAEAVRQRRVAMKISSARQHEIDLEHAASGNTIDPELARLLRPILRAHRLLAEIERETDPTTAPHVSHLLAKQWLETWPLRHTRFTAWRYCGSKLLQLARGIRRRWARRDIERTRIRDKVPTR